MKKPSIQKLFNRKASRRKRLRAVAISILACSSVAGALVLEDNLRRPGDSILDQIEIRIADGQLAYPQHLKNPETDGQRRLAALFKEASETSTGRNIMNNAANDGVKIRFDETLDETDACGFYTIGRYSFSKKLISLNPADRVSDVRRIATMVHEARHHRQNELGANEYGNGNTPLHERVIMKWFKEADARMFSIVFAWEQKQLGNEEYLKKLKTKNGYKPMVKAFENALADDPDDMKGAMRAAIRESYNMDKFERSYANQMLAWIESHNKTFDPDAPTQSILGDQIFWQLGNAGIYGNYMTADLIDEIRSSFTSQDYDALSKVRQESGGTRGSACGKDQDDEAKPKTAARLKKTPVASPA